MNIVFIEAIPKKVPVFDKAGKAVKENGVQVMKDEFEMVQIDFETHPHEILGSAINRFLKLNKDRMGDKGLGFIEGAKPDFKKTIKENNISAKTPFEILPTEILMRAR